jgi:hypothetical protein
MDEGYTYGSPDGDRIALYVPIGYDPPLSIAITDGAGPVVFDLISERSLTCDNPIGAKGGCGSFECHRAVLGQCQCGRHPDGVRMTKATQNDIDRRTT